MTLTVASRVLAASAGEDRAVYRRRGAEDILLVADGAGGSGAGALAAEALVDMVRGASSLDP